MYRRLKPLHEMIRQIIGYLRRIDSTRKENSMTPIRLLLADDEQGFIEALMRRLVSRDYRAAYVLGGEEDYHLPQKQGRRFSRNA
jgi:hypothetical protein